MDKYELIALAKELAELEDLTPRSKDVAFLKKEAVRILNRDDDSIADLEARKELEKYYNQIFSKLGEMSASIYDQKKELINKAKALLKEENFKKAFNEYNDIFEEFKAIGNCGKEKDDELWAELKDVKAKLNENRQAHFDKLNAAIEASKAKKEELVKQAKEVANSDNFKDGSNKMNDLMNEWKKAGFAGKEADDALWADFSEARKAFFDKKNAYFEDMKKVFEEKAAKKEELIKKGKVLLANSTFSDEEVTAIKELRQAWKEIGFAGKDKEDALWNEFNFIINKYFQEMKTYR